MRLKTANFGKYNFLRARRNRKSPILEIGLFETFKTFPEFPFQRPRNIEESDGLFLSATNELEPPIGHADQLRHCFAAQPYLLSCYYP